MKKYTYLYNINNSFRWNNYFYIKNIKSIKNNNSIGYIAVVNNDINDKFPSWLESENSELSS